MQANILLSIHMRINNIIARFRRAFRARREMRIIKQSKLLDQDWYLTRYPDVATAQMDPVVHYYYCGYMEGRDPGPLFNTVWYCDAYLKNAKQHTNPLVHYMLLGKSCNYSTTPPTPWWTSINSANDSVGDWWKVTLTSDLEETYNAVIKCNQTVNAVAVIIPIYNASTELAVCLDSLQRYTNQSCRFILINDASTDPKISELLKAWSLVPGFEIYENEINLGFTRTVNKAIKLAGESDVILLNSDTIVSPRWLSNLKLAAYSSPNIGTVTPFSDNAGAFSAPEMGNLNPVPHGVSKEAYARAITQASLRSYPRVPTGNGFCLYIRRDCLEETGLLDAVAFPRGYGEENDFCMRAGKLGWEHIIDDATLIYHVRSASFGAEKLELMKQGRKIIDERYPDYSSQIRVFSQSEPLIAARQRIGSIASGFLTGDINDVKPRVVYVLSTQTGGTPQTNQDLMEALGDNIEAFTLLSNSYRISLLHFQQGAYTEVASHLLSERIFQFPHRSREYDAVVASWLIKFAIELIHIRHIAWHSLGLADISRSLNIPIVHSFHDYYALCPTVNLLDDEGVYCAGRCTKSNGQCRSMLWQQFETPELKHSAVYVWRDQFSVFLEQCDAFVTTDESTKKLYQTVFPFLQTKSFSLIPHGRDLNSINLSRTELPAEGEPLRILIPGNLTLSKGSDIVATLARLVPGCIEIHILGRIGNDVVIPKTPNVIIHGAYGRGEFSNRVRDIKPHIGAVLSICPETYCHTLTELWACGLPVIAFDLGATGTRIRKNQGGWLISERSAYAVFHIIKHIRGNQEELKEKIKNVLRWQQGEGASHTCLWMGEQYIGLYASLAQSLQSARNCSSEVSDKAFGPQLDRLQCNMASSRAPIFLAYPETNRQQKSRLVLVPSLRHDLVPAGSGFIRLLIPYQNESIQTDWSIGVNVSATLPHPDTADVALFQRGDSSIFDFKQLQEWISVWRRHGNKLIYDIDDDLLTVDALSERGIVGDIDSVVKKVKWVASSADLVTVSTPYLLKKLQKLNQNVLLVPNAIDGSMWHKRKRKDSQQAFDRVIRIGYMGTQTHDNDLMLVTNAMQLIQGKYKERVSIEVIGAFQTKSTLFGEKIPLPQHTDYPNFVAWMQRAVDWDIGIIPLAENEFNKSKSNLKFLEYSAMGMAIICSNTPSYEDVAQHEINCLVVQNTTESWYDALSRLIDSEVLRSRIATEAYNQVMLYKTIAKNRIHIEVLKQLEN